MIRTTFFEFHGRSADRPFCVAAAATCCRFERNFKKTNTPATNNYFRRLGLQSTLVQRRKEGNKYIYSLQEKDTDTIGIYEIHQITQVSLRGSNTVTVSELISNNLNTSVRFNNNP